MSRKKLVKELTMARGGVPLRIGEPEAPLKEEEAFDLKRGDRVCKGPGYPGGTVVCRWHDKRNGHVKVMVELDEAVMYRGRITDRVGFRQDHLVRAA
jgi:hypothetical protein